MEEQFVCQYCGRILKKNYGLTFHEKHCHENPNRIIIKVEQPKTKCEICGKLIQNSNLQRHLRTHENGNFEKYNSITHISHDGLNCLYCGKLCKNKNSLIQHEIRCSKNENRIELNYNSPMLTSHPAWNKGLTKETDERIRKGIETFYRNLEAGKFKPSFLGRAVKEETKEKIRNSIHLDTLIRHNRSKWGTYKGIHCDSSWELAFLVYHLEHGSNIKRNLDGFEYVLDGKKHKYFPDFIIDSTYYEIKGLVNDLSLLKFNAAKQHVNIELIDYDKIQPYLNYMIKKYGDNFCEFLYDKDEPNYLNFGK